ncbi:hypothetical protein BO82DRAFT_163325 [Aspergillus uvarum CBS 121591]|uniref:Uncharacterized protein n=1 Tax=Aspergillus uvarum CBS 121591 TaxID=1448315 RepID=A0A319D3E5_9EURO|nr:hypothetical protein BO82DRAFT_163325 [Aspergillus uvarum CBS 121591]PYH85553.1 hypothetical protein BO82DRAFT_163325 [Aspergillus uvarum CBS 121591]
MLLLPFFPLFRLFLCIILLGRILFLCLSFLNFAVALAHRPASAMFQVTTPHIVSRSESGTPLVHLLLVLIIPRLGDNTAFARRDRLADCRGASSSTHRPNLHLPLQLRPPTFEPHHHLPIPPLWPPAPQHRHPRPGPRPQ